MPGIHCGLRGYLWHADFPLIYAASCSEQAAACAKLLLDSGADLFVADGQGRTCFYAAAAFGKANQAVGSMLLHAMEVCPLP